MTNYTNAKTDNTQQNSKCRLHEDRDEMVNHMISGYSKLAQKGCMTRYDWVGKVVHWELCKRLKFDRTNKWFIQNVESVQENET